VKAVVAAFVAAVGLSGACAAAEMGRVELNGRTIVIDSDGTWSYLDEAAADAPRGDCTLLRLDTPPVEFCLLEADWRRADLGGDFAFGFQSRAHDLYFGVIGEITAFDYDTMRKLIRENASDSAGLKGLMNNEDETATINGAEWGVVRFELEFGTAPIDFENYFTIVPDRGTAQFVFWSPSQIFDATAEIRARVAETLSVVD
jgi:hypothetical protein